MIKVALVIIPLVFVVLLCVNLVRGEGGRTTGRYLLLGILTAVLVFGISFCLCAGTNYLTSEDPSCVELVFNYAKASSGLNPNGSRFNSSSIVENRILKKAIKRGGFDVSVADLKASLSVTNDLSGVAYYSESDYKILTKYYLVYTPTDATRRLNGDQVVKTVADVYYEDFVKKYTGNYDVLNVITDEISSLDYLDISTYLGKEAERISQYMSSCKQENTSFVASNGETFDSIQKKIQNYRNVLLENLDSYILMNGLSKDANQYISKLEYDNKLTDVYYQKHVSAYNIRLDAIDMYDEDLARIVLVPTADKNGEFYMSQTQIGVDYFADQADQHMTEYAKLQLQIEKNNYTISRLSEGAKKSADSTTVENLVNACISELRKMASDSKVLVEEYNQAKSSAYITTSQRPVSRSTRFGLTKALVYGLVCALLALLWGLSLGRRKSD